MNERIEELKLQAIDFADATYKYDLREGFQIQEWDKIRLEKFAELIVRECACIADDMKTIETARAIKEHFGVEE